MVVTGLGVLSAIGQGKAEFMEALLGGKQRFHTMARKGRQRDTTFLGAEIKDLAVPGNFHQKVLRTTSLSALAALIAIDEAWQEANLAQVDPGRIGLVVGGSNFQQRELVELHERYAQKPNFLRPTYAVNFMDTDVCGICSEHFGILGPVFTVGAASASGQMAVIQAAQMVQSGMADVCIAVGALMDISYWECTAFKNMGAMGSDRYADRPDSACRPFDSQRDGFIFGEACAALVIERGHDGIRSGIAPYAAISGWGVASDGNRNPDPSVEGEARAITQAMQRAGLVADSIDYVNPHGTASKLGDQVELEAIRRCGLSKARINTTKSIIGHGLSAAGVMELAASILQMDQATLHPCLNLEEPMDHGFGWVGGVAEACEIRHALNLSFGFGGINTAVCISNWQV